MLRILVHLDGSKTSEVAILSVKRLLNKLTPREKTEITLLYVFPSMSHYVTVGEVVVKIRYNKEEMALIERRARNYLTKFAEELKSQRTKVKAKVMVGNPAKEIIKVSEKTKADLVAVSTYERRGLSRWFCGSVNDKVVQAGSFPVLVMKAPKSASNM